MRAKPHLSDRDLTRSQNEIVSIQRRDLELLNAFADALFCHAERARAELSASVVLLCNAETEEVIPSPLDWDGATNVLRLDSDVYASVKRALAQADDGAEAVVLIYRRVEDALSVYTIAPSAV